MRQFILLFAEKRVKGMKINKNFAVTVILSFALIFIFTLFYINMSVSNSLNLSNLSGVDEFETLYAGLTSDTDDSEVDFEAKKYIKWVDYNVCYAAMEKALSLDIKSHGIDGEDGGVEYNWIEMLAYLSARYGGDFKKYRERDILNLADKLKRGEDMGAITENMKYYPYYLEAYSAVLGGFVGYYDVWRPDRDNPDERIFSEEYGLKVYNPFARGYAYSDFDDFGEPRNYGYKRKHLGHDMLGSIGTPIVAVESGVIEAIGWNQYGGWRIGIRSFDGRRYYYYAHLRKNHPFHKSLKEGDTVQAGQVIGYLGMTGYSVKENVNNISTPHLHLGLQLIFDESQKDGSNQIWISMYNIVKLLEKNRMPVVRDADGKDYKALYAPPDAVSAEGEINGFENALETEIPLPVIMYHELTDNAGRASEFVSTAAEFEQDLIYLRDNGYNTITVADLLAYVRNGEPLADKPVMLTFDDGSYGVYKYAFPLLKKYNMRAVLSIVGAFTDKATEEYGAQKAHPPCLTWEEVKEAHDSGFIEIQNHTYDMHTAKNGRTGVKRRWNEGAEAYGEVLKNDIGHLQDNISKYLDYTPTAFTYPFGAFSGSTNDILKELGFAVTFSCSQKISIVTDEGSLFMLGRLPRSHNVSVEMLFKKHQ